MGVHLLLGRVAINKSKSGMGGMAISRRRETGKETNQRPGEGMVDGAAKFFSERLGGQSARAESFEPMYPRLDS